MERPSGPKIHGREALIYLLLEEMCQVLRHRTNTQGLFAGVKSETFSKGSLNHTAPLGEGLHGEPFFLFSRPISGGRNCRGPGSGRPGCAEANGCSEAPSSLPIEPGTRIIPQFQTARLEVSLSVGLTADWNHKGNRILQSFTNGLNRNHKAWKFKGFGKNAVLFFMSLNGSGRCLWWQTVNSAGYCVCCK